MTEQTFEEVVQNQVHGHDVMHMMLAMGGGFTRESLKAAIINQFGPETRFYTCSAQGMDADGIIRFLEARGKFRPVADGFNTDPDKICNH